MSQLAATANQRHHQGNSQESIVTDHSDDPEGPTSWSVVGAVPAANSEA